MIGTFKEALQEDIRKSIVPAKVVAEELDMSYSMLMNATNPDQPDYQFQAKRLVLFAKVTGQTAAIDFINAAIGRVAFAVPESCSAKDINNCVAENVSSFGQMLTDCAEVMADGRVSEIEAKRLEKGIDELLRRAAELRCLVQKMAQD